MMVRGQKGFTNLQSMIISIDYFSAFVGSVMAYIVTLMIVKQVGGNHLYKKI